jgi:ABC-2 type transport system permease protein
MQPVALDSAPPVAVHGLAKRFHGADALRDVTFEVRPGEILGLLGANGAGKTTTLHMILGLIRPNAGSVRLFGVDPQRDKRAALARVGFASPEAMMDWRLRALLLRYLLLLRREPARWVDAFYWPLLDVLVWGFITIFVAERGIALPNAAAVFLGAIILWNLFFRVSQDVSVSFLDDVWARSVVTIFASPLSMAEFVVAIMALGLIKVMLTLVAVSTVAFGATPSTSSTWASRCCPSSRTWCCSAGPWACSAWR